jgi:hypothetical protein
MPTQFGAQHWRDRAAEARTIAGQIREGESKTAMMKIAAQYEKIAKHTERIEQIEAAAAKRKNSN